MASHGTKHRSDSFIVFCPFPHSRDSEGPFETLWLSNQVLKRQLGPRSAFEKQVVFAMVSVETNIHQNDSNVDIFSGLFGRGYPEYRDQHLILRFGCNWRLEDSAHVLQNLWARNQAWFPVQ